MSNKSPIFPICEPQHFSDYGFDPQIDYFQVLEEAKRHNRETLNINSSTPRSSIDALHFKLQKPISKDEYFTNKKIKKKRWWKNALHFFKGKHPHGGATGTAAGAGGGTEVLGNGVPYCTGRPVCRASVSGPIYITESRSGSSTPYRTTCSRPTSGPLAGTLTPVEKDEVQNPYISLREFELDQHQQQHRFSTSSAMPIYLVT
ncbi:OLC1v1020508C1 [Oldenlandia corymbosa var. corymbosa]|uniref:OLC1v1020508C1 n=1 Tax=Oldenlandia corymbosa var. corymbosa TaxID=529605 RepID=A0AAV1EGJ2_OLDCO|nr:OLC1v1020508C1 [Oldenlandia corymbosa var. corymbosa]